MSTDLVVPQAHVQGAISGPHHSGSHGQPQIVMLQPQQGPGAVPQHPQHGPQQGAHQHFYIQQGITQPLPQISLLWVKQRGRLKRGLYRLCFIFVYLPQRCRSSHTPLPSIRLETKASLQPPRLFSPSPNPRLLDERPRVNATHLKQRNWHDHTEQRRNQKPRSTLRFFSTNLGVRAALGGAF